MNGLIDLFLSALFFDNWIEKNVDAYFYISLRMLVFKNFSAYNIRKIVRKVIGMPKQIENLLQAYRNELSNILDSHIKKVILYGSYARGDFDKDSDIDIMILVDFDDLKMCEDKIIDLTYDFNLEHGTEIMPVVQNINHFEHWKNAYMFYNNVSREGVPI